MRVLLVNPRIDNMIRTNIPSYVDQQRGYNPPLGLMYVAAFAERYTDHEIHILDMQAEEVTYDSFRNEFNRIKPDVIGITTTTFTLIDAMIVAKMSKAANKDTKVILGGPHAHIYPHETIRLPEVDFLILGEGEKPFAEVLENIDNHESLKNVKGIVFKHSSEVVSTPPATLIDDLDSLPFPARHLTKVRKYSSLLAQGTLVTTMITSRGCPYSCLFCHRPHLGRKFRARSAKNVVDEMEKCVNMGITEFLIYDDTFTIDRQRVMDICQLISDRSLNVVWDIRARVDLVDIDMLKAMRKAGCQRIHYGVESASPQILKVLQKGITLPQVEAAFKMTKEAGIGTLAYFMLGSPSETREQIIDTIEYAKKLEPDYCHFSITTPFPSTALYEMGIKNEIFGDYWREFGANPHSNFTPQYWEENVSRDELDNLLDQAYRSFYLRPKYVLKQIRNVRSFGELMRKAKAASRVLKR